MKNRTSPKRHGNHKNRISAKAGPSRPAIRAISVSGEFHDEPMMRVGDVEDSRQDEEVGRFVVEADVLPVPSWLTKAHWLAFPLKRPRSILHRGRTKRGLPGARSLARRLVPESGLGLQKTCNGIESNAVK